MGKRRHSDKNDQEYIAYKIKNLERKFLSHNRNRRKRRVSSEISCSPPRYDSHESLLNIGDGPSIESELEKVDGDVMNPEPCFEGDSHPAADIASPPALLETTKNPVASTSSTGPANQVIEPPVPELDSEILEIIGADPSVTKTYGKDIQSDLAVRFQHVATKGLTKELRKERVEKYLPPGNCSLIDAPELNPEIRAAVSKAVQKREKGIEQKQKQLASALAYLGEAMTLLLASEDKKIKLLIDTSRLICDCQNADLALRRNFVFYNLKKKMKDQLQKTKIDKFLFGTDLPETLKAAKAISKSGTDLKSTQAAKPPLLQSAKKTRPPTQKHLNWKAPPPYRRPRGNPRKKEPAQKNQHANFSRTSS